MLGGLGDHAPLGCGVARMGLSFQGRRKGSLAQEKGAPTEADAPLVFWSLCAALDTQGLTGMLR